jgi:hypothetical protein
MISYISVEDASGTPSTPETPSTPDSTSKDFKLLASDITAGTYTSNIEKNGFTILADTSVDSSDSSKAAGTVTVTALDKAKTISGVDYNSEIKTNGAGKTDNVYYHRSSNVRSSSVISKRY